MPRSSAVSSLTLARILRDSGCAQPSTAAVGYQEPSLVFLAGTDTRLTDTVGAVEFLRGGECRFALIEARQERGFAQRAEAVGLRYAAGPRIEAINSSGRDQHRCYCPVVRSVSDRLGRYRRCAAARSHGAGQRGALFALFDAAASFAIDVAHAVSGRPRAIVVVA
jgi:hypothetical protein